jgi:hypothetical protein
MIKRPVVGIEKKVGKERALGRVAEAAPVDAVDHEVGVF